MRTAGAVVDVANVCWSSRIPPVGRHEPLLSRLALIRECWDRQYGPAALTLIGDLSLEYTLPESDKPRLRKLVESGELRLVPHADPEILELARDKGLHVISADRFIDPRRAHPWIAGAADRFLSCEYGADGLQLVPSGIREVPEQVKSRHEEAKELGFAYRINIGKGAHRRVLRSEWRCTGRSCVEAMASPDRLTSWPRVDQDGSVRCPSCGSPLEEAGPRGITRMIVVADRAGGEIVRFPISEGVAVVVGRGRLSYGINLGAGGLPSPRARAQVSRQHVKLQLTGAHARLAAVDLGSSNGTTIRRGNAPRESRLKPGTEVIVGDRDALLLGGAVVVRLSGHRFLPSLASPPELGDQGGSVTYIPPEEW